MKSQFWYTVMNEQHQQHKKGMAPFWIGVSIVSAALATIVAMRKMRQEKPVDVDTLIDAAERASKVLDERLKTELQMAG